MGLDVALPIPDDIVAISPGDTINAQGEITGEGTWDITGQLFEGSTSGSAGGTDSTSATVGRGDVGPWNLSLSLPTGVGSGEFVLVVTAIRGSTTHITQITFQIELIGEDDPVVSEKHQQKY